MVLQNNHFNKLTVNWTLGIMKYFNNEYMVCLNVRITQSRDRIFFLIGGWSEDANYFFIIILFSKLL